MRVAWQTVGTIIQRVVGRRLRGDAATRSRTSASTSCRTGATTSTTVVVDHVRGHVVWAKPGKNADTLKAFFGALGDERCAKLEAVTIDMSGGYIKAVTDCSPQLCPAARSGRGRRGSP